MSKIKNIQDYEYYLEFYNQLNITISTTVNQNGTIWADDEDNLIGSIAHSGSNYITSITKTIAGNILLYDDYNFLYIDGNSTEDSFIIKPNTQLRYKIGADKVTNATVDGNKILTNLTNKTVFNLMVNGREINSSNYSKDNAGITLSVPYNKYLTGINDDIVIYTYSNTQTISSGTLILTYQSPHNLVPEPEYLDDKTYFDTYTTEICKFESFNVSVSRNINYINNLYQYVNINFGEEANRQSKINITMYEDLRSELRGKRFRMLAYDKDDETLVMYSNCVYTEGETKNIDRSKNVINYVIDFEDEISINYSGALPYGEGTYGEGVYGSKTFTNNNYET